MFNFKGFDFTVTLPTDGTITASNDLGGYYKFMSSVPVTPYYIIGFEIPKHSRVRLYPHRNNPFDERVIEEGKEIPCCHPHEPLTNGQRILLDKIGLELVRM